MPAVTVKLFAQYREGRFRNGKRDYPEGTTVGELIEAVGIDESASPPGVVLVNGCRAANPQVLREGDTIAIFPMVGGG
jgi:molybdopterin converting factor small subunit